MSDRSFRRPLLLGIAATLLVVAAGLRAQDPAADAARRPPLAPRLAPTQHPPLPGHLSLYWLLPDAAPVRSTAVARAQDDAAKRLARGAALIAEGNFAAGLPLVSGNDLAGTSLSGYARYYTGVALMGLGRLPEADTALASADALKPEGYLKQAVPMQIADVALARRDPKDAVDTLDDLSDEKLVAPEDVLLRLGKAAELAGDTDKALKAYRRVYYEFPLSTQAFDAQSGLERLETVANAAPDRFKQELARAERLFAARRWAQSRAGFEPLGRAATAADDRELVALRLAECDYYLDRARVAREALRPFLTDASRKAEARFFFLLATRALGEADAYVTMVRAMVAEFPTSSWTEEALNNLASYHIVQNDDPAADEVFRDLYRRFPQGRFAERAAWKIGWWAYKNGQFAETAATFDAAATTFARGDMRPAWLYWSGRARDQAGDTLTANSRYRLAVTDYQNSYYGRLSAKLLADRREPPVADSVTSTAVPMPSPLIPTDALVRQLVGLELYADALKELQYAQRAWGDSPAVQATIAWIRHEQGLEQVSMERFQNLRGAITLMKRAYPQYLAAGGEELPPEVLRIMFPLDYWPLIKKYSDAHSLDPYLMAALIAQESTFTADIRSAANAYGLMQLIPAAGRQYARKVGLGRYSQGLLTQPESNVRMGMAYFKDLSDRFGGNHFALAGYNAGPHRVARWISERPAVVQDEFIDDIPFPETQNYVKRILGTAEDYRRLYAAGGALAPPAAVAAPKPATPSTSAPAAPRRRR